ncbi:MAG: hypothetical protein JSS86_11775 [Cyanobacteria bacterium SZAS LIN-2]|nr:hypothetical protein [Cyanobacteria bacterium SZAS LIN-3]MBS1996987.1 hypothetical protein [Cyanobacteria bacterium SZAS LIN-2]
MDMPAEINEAQAQTAASVYSLEEKSTTSNARFGITILLCLCAIPIFVYVDTLILGVLLLYFLILALLLQATRSSAPAIARDTSLYRRFIRPVGRILAWVPVAAIITCIVVAAIAAILCDHTLALLVTTTGIASFAIPFCIDAFENSKGKSLQIRDSNSDMDKHASKRI